jgi:hypothetical protein
MLKSYMLQFNSGDWLQPQTFHNSAGLETVSKHTTLKPPLHPPPPPLHHESFITMTYAPRRLTASEQTHVLWPLCSSQLSGQAEVEELCSTVAHAILSTSKQIPLHLNSADIRSVSLLVYRLSPLEFIVMDFHARSRKKRFITMFVTAVAGPHLEPEESSTFSHILLKDQF